jgi:hypothetical protein
VALVACLVLASRSGGLKAVTATRTRTRTRDDDDDDDDDVANLMVPRWRVAVGGRCDGG